MDQADLTAPLLQLNPPVLVRATGSDPSTINLFALRRAITEAVLDTPAIISSQKPLSTGVAAPSHVARKLHDAKRTAQNVYRQACNVTTPTASGVSLAPLLRVQAIRATGKCKGPLAGDTKGHEAITYSAAAATADNSGHLSAADVRHGLVSALPSPTAASIPSPRASSHAPLAATVTATATAAMASADSQAVSMSMPYLMRHIQDTGALLDTLFPIQPQPAAAAPSCTGSPSGASFESEAGEEDAEHLFSVQTVSAAPAFREDVVALHAALQERLEARRAQPTGLCPIRRALYRDLFSELVRQVTVEEPARGLLLARVREEAEHALQVHAALLREGQRFASGKLLRDTHDTLALKERLAALHQEKVALEIRKHELLETCKEVEQRFEEERQLRLKQQQDEIKYLRHANQQLSLRLKMETERESVAGEMEGSGEAAPAMS
ncbi:hypothetical protein LSCM1_02608 [Leishmania martiniquensis]|uniref:33 kDa inner dynein arm light chain, axonemal n=1 Tax=Leishmania martiniquensis TaxID=1580590 RepID=A0A836H1Z3_9TRYP|nr:hypothetical protein LSCM1_02608 [Leishmania martiniquensis]